MAPRITNIDGFLILLNAKKPTLLSQFLKIWPFLAQKWTSKYLCIHVHSYASTKRFDTLVNVYVDLVVFTRIAVTS